MNITPLLIAAPVSSPKPIYTVSTLDEYLTQLIEDAVWNWNDNADDLIATAIGWASKV